MMAAGKHTSLQASSFAVAHKLKDAADWHVVQHFAYVLAQQ